MFNYTDLKHTTISRRLVRDIAQAFGHGNARQVNEYQFFSLSRLALANPSHTISLGLFKYPVFTEEYSLIEGRHSIIQSAHPEELLYSETTGGWLLIDDTDANPYDPVWTELMHRIPSGKQLLHINDKAVLMLNVRLGEVQRGTCAIFEMRIKYASLTVISVEPNLDARTDVIVALTPNSLYSASVIQAPSKLTSVWSSFSLTPNHTGLMVMQLEDGAIISIGMHFKRKYVQWKNKRFTILDAGKAFRHARPN